MDKRNPYQIDRYGEAGVSHGALASAASLIGCVVAMAALCIGMLFLMWRAGAR